MVPPADLDDAIAQLEERDQKIEQLTAELALLKRHLFGRRREKIDPNQLGLFSSPPPSKDEIESVELPARTVKRKKEGHGRASFPDHLPRETLVLDVPVADRCCADCKAEMQPIGEEVTERGHIVPAKLVVKRYVRPKYACPNGHAVVTADLPDGVVERGKYEASVYGHVVAGKYLDHLPLARLERIFRRYGAPIAKQSMWDMLVLVDELVAQPVLKQMRHELLEESALHADETPVTLRTEGEKATRTAYAWLWRNLQTATDSKVLIEFRRSRSRDGPIAFLGDWGGTLIIDGYSGYDAACKANGIRRAGCWAHARRKFKNALDTGAKEAALILEPIQELFRIEREVMERAAAEGLTRMQLETLRAEVRAERSEAAVRAVAREADRLEGMRSTLPKSELGKALKYLTTQWDPLRQFLNDPSIPIHNNDAERDLRHVVTGRKNWLVFGSERGGEVACRLFSLVLSCVQNGADPEAYVTDVLGRISTTADHAIGELTPWAWAAARVPRG